MFETVLCLLPAGHRVIDVLPFNLYNKKSLAILHTNRTFFPTTLWIPSYDIGKEVWLRTYQHPLL